MRWAEIDVTQGNEKGNVSSMGVSRGANQRMNPDFAESAPKVADFADFWPIFPADEV